MQTDPFEELAEAKRELLETVADMRFFRFVFRDERTTLMVGVICSAVLFIPYVLALFGVRL